MEKKWCRCPKCGHKLFLYDSTACDKNVAINIKCSSCKKIIDVYFSDNKVACKEAEKDGLE